MGARDIAIEPAEAAVPVICTRLVALLLPTSSTLNVLPSAETVTSPLEIVYMIICTTWPRRSWVGQLVLADAHQPAQVANGRAESGQRVLRVLVVRAPLPV